MSQDKQNQKVFRKIRDNCQRRYRAVVPKKFRVKDFLEVLGLKTWEEYYEYLEKQFEGKRVKFKGEEKPMIWNFYGFSWHIDHIRPLHIFDPESSEDQKIMFNYKNTQPMDVDEHVTKTIKDLGKDDLNEYGQIWMMFRDN